jgi:hypothetical protein
MRAAKRTILETLLTLTLVLNGLRTSNVATQFLQHRDVFQSICTVLE